jgi:hypothetical protein
VDPRDLLQPPMEVENKLQESACEKEKIKFGKWFKTLKKGNNFTKIKEGFPGQLIMFSIDHDFQSYQTPENREKKSFSINILHQNKWSLNFYHLGL